MIERTYKAKYIISNWKRLIKCCNYILKLKRESINDQYWQ